MLRVRRLIKLYPIIMKITSTAKPNGYSGIGGGVAAGMTVNSTQPDESYVM